jgi:flagellar M-ring protein FliF
MPGMDRLTALAQQLRGFFQALPPGRRASFLAITALVILGTIGGAVWVQMPRYRVLFAQLEGSDAGSVIEYLKEEKIPYRVGEGGSAIEVPSEHVYEVRMALAGRGVPQGGGVGYELFDQQTLGMTDFVQRLGYQRALQGELARTIGELSAVERARVHLALPERSLFVSEERPPTASVVLRLRAGRSLSDEQVQGVVHLVAASVEGLDPANVTVVDTAGRVLTHPSPNEGEEPPAQAMHGHQRAIEAQLVESIESMLERVLGPGHAVARVTADLDLSRIEETQESFDPDRTAVRSERRSSEKNSEIMAAGGVPGVTATLTNEGETEAAGGGSIPKSEREDATLSYEVSKTTSHRVGAMGGIEKLSIAVLIDGVSSDKEGGDDEFVPRPEEELNRYEELIKRAVGFDKQRGDEIEVVSAPFQMLAPPAIGEPTIWEQLESRSEMLWRAAGLVVMLILGMAVVRPFLLAMVNRAPLPPPVPIVEVEEEEELVLPPPRQVNSGLLEIARQNPEQTAMVIKQWVAGGN